MGVKSRKKYTIPWFDVIAENREEALLYLKQQINEELLRVRRNQFYCYLGQASDHDYSIFECACIDDEDSPLVGEARNSCDCEEVCQEVSF